MPKLTMKAFVYEKYGSPDVLEIQEIDRPTVSDRDVLIRVHASCVNAADWHFLTGTPWVLRLVAGLSRPKRRILGLDAAGTVEAVGEKVVGVQPGDDVIATSDHMGGFAEYVCVSEDEAVPKPASLTYEEAAAVPAAALTALQGLRDQGKIQQGKKVLINGASGGVGTFAVQIAKSFGAEVTGVCSTRNVDTARAIGADFVIDYTTEDFAHGGRQYDLILDMVGNRPLSDLRRLLTQRGIYVAATGSPIRLLWIGMAGRKKMVSWVSRPNKQDLVFLKELLEAGKVKPVIDRRYPFREVPDALRYIGEGHARGKVIITM
jgi:NADPH:quinone reductase-like Zn-dependent oxidoreductase